MNKTPDGKNYSCRDCCYARLDRRRAGNEHTDQELRAWLKRKRQPHTYIDTAGSGKRRKRYVYVIDGPMRQRLLPRGEKIYEVDGEAADLKPQFDPRKPNATFTVKTRRIGNIDSHGALMLLAEALRRSNGR